MTIKDSEKMRWEFLYKEWEYRHKTLWISFNLWGLIVSTLIFLPFLNKSVFEIGWSTLIFPIFGFGICLFASMHILSEAKRMAMVFIEIMKYREVLNWPHPHGERNSIKHKIQSLSFAKILGNIFLYVLAPFCISTIMIQSIILYEKFGNPFDLTVSGCIRFVIYFIAIALPIGGAWLALHRALKAQERKHIAQEIEKSEK